MVMLAAKDHTVAAQAKELEQLQRGAPASPSLDGSLAEQLQRDALNSTSDDEKDFGGLSDSSIDISYLKALEAEEHFLVQAHSS